MPPKFKPFKIEGVTDIEIRIKRKYLNNREKFARLDRVLVVQNTYYFELSITKDAEAFVNQLITRYLNRIKYFPSRDAHGCEETEE